MLEQKSRSNGASARELLVLVAWAGIALLPGALAPCSAEGIGPGADGLQADRRERQSQFLRLRHKLESLDRSDVAWVETLDEIGALRIVASTRYLVDFLNKELAAVEAARNKARNRQRVGAPFAECAIRALGHDGSQIAVGTILTQGFDALPEKRYTVISEALGTVPNPDAADWILKTGWKSILTLSPPAQITYVNVLAAMQDLRVIRPAQSLLGKPGCAPATQVQLVDLLRQLRAKSAAKKIARVYRVNDVDLKVAVLLALQELGASEHSELFFKALKSRHWEVRSTAVDVLRLSRQRELIPTLVPLLGDAHPQVRIATIQALLELGGDEVMDPLIAALATSTGRIQDDLAEALVRLSGKDFGINSASWESWWREHRGRVEIASISREDYDRLKSEGDQSTTGVYYGLRIISQAVTFIIDTSESMKEPYHVPAAGGKPSGRGRTQVPEGDPREQKYVERAKIEVAREELVRALNGLREGMQFNIIPFSSSENPWKPELVALTAAVREEAVVFVGTLRPSGTTNVYDTLTFALSDPKVDTIYLLSDGAPTAGLFTETADILSRIAEANQRLRVKIHTIGFNLQEDAEQLMRELAEQNHGRFVKM